MVDDLNTLSSVAQDDDDWEMVYNRVFKDSREIRSIIDSLGYNELDYYDPDASYEDDVRAYLNALAEYLDRVNRFERVTFC